MILAVITLFSLSAVLGLWLIVLGVRHKRSSLPLVAGHAVAAVLGLALLIQDLVAGPVRMLYNNAALLFVLTLLGAFVLLGLRISSREYRTPPPMVIVGLHAALALAGLLLLVMGYTRY